MRVLDIRPFSLPEAAHLPRGVVNDVTIREVLVPALEAAFPGGVMGVAAPPEPVAVFPAACTEVGDVQIYDDSAEATVVIENVTHHHTDPYDSEMTPSENCGRKLLGDRLYRTR